MHTIIWIPTLVPGSDIEMKQQDVMKQNEETREVASYTDICSPETIENHSEGSWPSHRAIQCFPYYKSAANTSHLFFYFYFP